MMLAAPPAAAMTYVKPSMGLDPSVYGGGGSPSSRSPLDGPSLVSLGSAAFVSATTFGNDEEEASLWKGGAGAKAGGCSVSESVTKALSDSVDGGAGKYRVGKLCEENEGGRSVESAGAGVSVTGSGNDSIRSTEGHS